MKLLQPIILLAIFFYIATGTAQEQYTIDGQEYSLMTEVDGPISLLWNTIDGEFRYFSKKGNAITELKNTLENGNFQEEYKSTLEGQTDGSKSTDNLKFTLPGLKKFISEYNAAVDSDFVYDPTPLKLSLRLGAFVGISNNAYFLNPDNTTLPMFGIDFEIVDEVKLKRHSLLVQFQQIIGNSDYDLSVSQLSLNYRFKFIKTEKVDVFVNAKIVEYSYANGEVPFLENSTENVATFSGGDFRVPGSFGVGADIALGNGFLTLAFYDFVSIGLDNNDNFPINASAGYKFKL